MHQVCSGTSGEVLGPDFLIFTVYVKLIFGGGYVYERSAQESRPEIQQG